MCSSGEVLVTNQVTVAQESHIIRPDYGLNNPNEFLYRAREIAFRSRGRVRHATHEPANTESRTQRTVWAGAHEDQNSVG